MALESGSAAAYTDRPILLGIYNSDPEVPSNGIIVGYKYDSCCASTGLTHLYRCAGTCTLGMYDYENFSSDRSADSLYDDAGNTIGTVVDNNPSTMGDYEWTIEDISVRSACASILTAASISCACPI